MSWYVYALTDPDGRIRYIGKTCNMPRRLRAHINEAKASPQSKRYVLRWINKLARFDQEPQIHCLEQHDTEVDCFHAEKRLIFYYRGCGDELCNITDGGLGGITGRKRPMSNLHRFNISWARRGKKGHPHTPESRLRIGVGNKGKRRSAEQRLAESRRKRLFTDEQILSIRAMSRDIGPSAISRNFGCSRGAIRRALALNYAHPPAL